MSRPVWLLDVDGPINGTRSGWSTAPMRKMAYPTGYAPQRMYWSAVLMSRIRDLIRVHDVEVRWATSWYADTRQLEQLFKLPHLPVAFSPGTIELGMRMAKTLAAVQVVQVEQRPLIWTDDDHLPWPGEHPFAEVFTGPDVLLLQPHPQRGLRPEHLDYIDAAVARWATV